MRLFEKILITPILWGDARGPEHEHSGLIRNATKNAPKIQIDNVAKFFYETSPKEYFKPVDDFPNVAPPWPAAFYEEVGQSRINSNGVITDDPWMKGFRQAVYMEALDLSELSEGRRLSIVKACSREFGFKYAEQQFRWLMFASTFVTHNSINKIIFEGVRQFCVTGDGGIVRNFNDGMANRVCKGVDHGDSLDRLFTSLLAISLTHCKNVELQRITPDAPLAKKQLKRYGVPKLSYDVIDIQPMTKALRTAGGLDTHGSLKQALHICRGHFKDYRQRGLFGKNKGLYWWGMHARGDQAHGIAKRDYTVSPQAEIM